MLSEYFNLPFGTKIDKAIRPLARQVMALFPIDFGLNFIHYNVMPSKTCFMWVVKIIARNWLAENEHIVNKTLTLFFYLLL